MTERRRRNVSCYCCGASIERRLSTIAASKSNRFYCSKECIKRGRGQVMSAIMKGNPVSKETGRRNYIHLIQYYINGNKPWNFDKQGKGLKCLYCGNLFDIHPHKLKENKGKYCSQNCYDKVRHNPDLKEDKRNRGAPDYKKWRKAVLKRDHYTCQHCEVTLESLHIHHLKKFKDNRQLRNELSNGITLCAPCHYKLHWGNK